MAEFIVFRNSMQKENWDDFLDYLEDNPSATPTTWLAAKGAGYWYTWDFGYRFYVIESGWRPTYSKQLMMINTTMSGRLDVSVGPILRSVDYVVRVRYLYSSYELTRTSAEMYVYPGTFDNLRDLFLLNNPNASPSNKIWLVSHQEADDVLSVGSPGVMVGDHIAEPLSVIITGTNAHYNIPISFKYLEAVS